MPITLAPNPVGPAINTAGYAANVEQGTQIYLTINGQILGFVTQVQQNDSYSPQPFYALGLLIPADIQPMQFRGQLTVSGGRLYGGGWFTGGIGSSQPVGQISPAATALLQSGALSIVVYNLVTDQPDAIFYGVVPNTFNCTWQNGAYTVQQFTALYRSVA